MEAATVGKDKLNKIDVAELMVLFTAMGFVTKATEKFSGSYKSPPNGDLKIEVTCSASGRKTTLVKSPHACKCPVQKEVLYPPVEKVSPNVDNVFLSVINLILEQLSVIFDKSRAKSTSPLIPSPKIPSISEASTMNISKLDYVVKEFSLSSTNVSILNETVNSVAKTQSLASQNTPKICDNNNKRISNLKSISLPTGNTPTLKKFPSRSNTPASLTKPKVITPISTPKIINKPKVSSTVAKFTPKINGQAVNRPKISPLPKMNSSKITSTTRCTSSFTSTTEKSTTITKTVTKK